MDNSVYIQNEILRTIFYEGFVEGNIIIIQNFDLGTLPLRKGSYLTYEETETYWQLTNNYLSPKELGYKVIIGGTSTVYDETLRVIGKIASTDGYYFYNDKFLIYAKSLSELAFKYDGNDFITFSNFQISSLTNNSWLLQYSGIPYSFVGATNTGMYFDSSLLKFKVGDTYVLGLSSQGKIYLQVQPDEDLTYTLYALVYDPASKEIKRRSLSQLHSHSNVSVLNNLSDSGGKLAYNGVLVADFTNYYTKTQIDSSISNLQNQINLKADATHNHALNSLSEKSYNSLTDKPDLSSLHTHDNKSTLDLIPLYSSGNIGDTIIKTSNGLAWGSSGLTGLNSNILYWDTNSFYYTPYSSKQSGVNFYYGTDIPDGMNILNLNALLRVTGLILYSDLIAGNIISDTLTIQGYLDIYESNIAAFDKINEDGLSIKIAAGSALNGDYNGGNLYFVTGNGSGIGINGDIYFGDGTAGVLKEKTLEYLVVYYDDATGKLSYGYLPSGSTINNDILYFNGSTLKYTPYSTKQSSLIHFYLGTTAPTNTSRLNLDAYLYATKLYSGGVEVSVVTHTHNFNSDILYWDNTNQKYMPYVSKQSSLVHFYTGTTDPNYTARLNLDASLYTTELVSSIKSDLIQSNSVSYVPGLFGSGFKLWKDTSNKYVIELDSLFVRGTLNAYEFRINRFRASNGSIIVTDAVKAKSGLTYDSNAGKYYFEVEDVSEITFQANDLIQAQAFNGISVYNHQFKVYSINSTKIYVVNPDGSNPTQVDISNKEFVRLGNTTNKSRKSFISLSVGNTIFSNPSIEIWDGVNSFTRTSSMIKVRMGNLGGLTFNGINIGGYGLYSTNAYLQGVINATSGKIGNWDISGGYLSASDSNGRISIGQEINLYDASNIQRVNIWKGNIGGISYYTEGSSLSWTGTYASYYTTNLHVLNSFVNLSNQTYYIQSSSTSNDNYLKTYTSLQSSSYHIDISSNKNYIFNLQLAIYVSFTLDADDTNPDPDGLTTENFINGSYSIAATVYVYNSSNVLLGRSAATSVDFIPENGESYTHYLDVAINLNCGLITTSQVYFKIVYSITNNINEKRINTYYRYLGGIWEEWYKTETYHNIDSTFYVYLSRVKLQGNTGGFVQIGKSGFQNIKDATHYFRTDQADASYIMETKGLVKMFSNEESWPVWINRNYNSNTNPVLLLSQEALSSGTCKVIQFKASSSFSDKGYIQCNIDTATLSFVTGSDERLKQKIQLADFNALNLIRDIKLKKYEIKETGAITYGWVAQDFIEKYELPLVGLKEYKEKGEYLGFSKDYLIEILWKAMEEMIERIDNLENILNRLK